MLLGCTGEMPPLYSALCFCFYFAYRYARLLDCRIGSMSSSHESRISRGQKRLRLLTGNCREYLLNLHGTVMAHRLEVEADHAAIPTTTKVMAMLNKPIVRIWLFRTVRTHLEGSKSQERTGIGRLHQGFGTD